MFYYPAGGEITINRLMPDLVAASVLSTGQELDIEACSNHRFKLRGLPADPPDALAPS